MTQRDELSSLHNCLKRRLQDVDAEIQLARIVKTFLAERIDILELENRCLRAKRKISRKCLNKFLQLALATNKGKKETFFLRSIPSLSGWRPGFFLRSPRFALVRPLSIKPMIQTKSEGGLAGWMLLTNIKSKFLQYY